ncbi:PrsW family glutamic-type intramembrane protease [Cryptosporangium sp. NPDC051539]|uniref:PrsW family glutamic-type intramembrane protease n=1 Tax=Cryptosporangium sp. NPDC051539 TaxID=3363962 RepID=UPI00379628B8
MQWRRDLWLAVLAIGAGFFAAGERLLAASDLPGLVTPVLVIGLGTAPAAFWVGCVARSMRFALPTWVVGFAALAGAVLGATFAGLLGYPVLDSLGIVAGLAVALVKVSVTMLVPLAVLFALPSRRAADGLLTGAAAGCGFVAAETVAYLVTASSSVGPTAHAVLVRGFFGSAAYLAWGGIAGVALWLAAAEHWSGRAVRRFVLALVGVVVLHALWDGMDGVPGRLALTVLSVGVLAGVMAAAARRAVSSRLLPRTRPPASGVAGGVAGPAARGAAAGGVAVGGVAAGGAAAGGAAVGGAAAGGSAVGGSAAGGRAPAGVGVPGGGAIGRGAVGGGAVGGGAVGGGAAGGGGPEARAGAGGGAPVVAPVVASAAAPEDAAAGAAEGGAPG